MEEETDEVYHRTRRDSKDLPPAMSELRVVLMGNSWSDRSVIGNFMLGQPGFNTEEEPETCVSFRGQIMEKEVLLINTPDLLVPSISQYKLTQHIKNCVRLSAPGPHVFLLVLQPKTFNEDHKVRLCRFLENFSDRSFENSVVLLRPHREEAAGVQVNLTVSDMVKKCRGQFVYKKTTKCSELLEHLEKIVQDNNGQHVSCDMFVDPTPDVQVTGMYDAMNQMKSTKNPWLYGVNVERVHENKFLGVIIDDELNLTPHIRNVQSKVSNISPS